MRARTLELWTACLVLAGTGAGCDTLFEIDKPTLKVDGADGGPPKGDGGLSKGDGGFSKGDGGLSKEAGPTKDAARDVAVVDARDDVHRADAPSDGTAPGTCVCASPPCAPQVIVPAGATTILDLFVDSSGVYLATQDSAGGGNVLRAPLDGSAQPSGLVSLTGVINRVVHAGGYVYWLEEGNSALLRSSTALGSAKVETVAQYSKMPQELVISGDTALVFGLNANDVTGTIFSIDLSSVTADGGPPVNVYFDHVAGTTAALVTDGVNAYWQDGGGILSCHVTGCTTSDPLTYGASTNPAALAVDSSYVVWSDVQDNAVYKTPLTMGARSTVLTQLASHYIAVDEASVYSAPLLTAITRAPLAGGTAVTVYTGSQPTEHMAVQGDCLYWVGGPDGANGIFATAK
jgi:hypothetical protein